MARLRASLAIAAAAAACGGKAHTIETCGACFTAPYLTIEVADTTGEPICNASVVLSGPATTSTFEADTATPDASCAYTIQVTVADGTYSIVASAPGFETASQGIQVTTPTGPCCEPPEFSLDAGYLNDGLSRTYLITLRPHP